MIEKYPLLGRLVAMSEGQVLSDAEAARFVAEGAAFIADTRVGYVVIERAQVTEQLNHLAIEAFGLTPMAVDGSITLYKPRE
jgi:hypothetical protein